MAFEIEGKLHKIFPMEQKTSSFAVREFVVEVPEGNYPQYVKFQVVQDRTGILDNFREGEKVKVSFDLRGREWQGKYFTTLNCWKIDRADAAGSDFDAPPPPPSRQSSAPAREENFPSDPFPNYADSPRQQQSQQQAHGFDDLPF